MSETHSARVNSRRRLLNVLAFVFNACRSNAKTILQDNGIKLTNFEMTYNPGEEWVLPAIRRRYSQSNGLKIIVINIITRVLGINEASPCAQLENFNANMWKLLLVRNLTRLKGRS